MVDTSAQSGGINYSRAKSVRRCILATCAADGQRKRQQLPSHLTYIRARGTTECRTFTADLDRRPTPKTSYPHLRRCGDFKTFIRFAFNTNRPEPACAPNPACKLWAGDPTS